MSFNLSVDRYYLCYFHLTGKDTVTALGQAATYLGQSAAGFFIWVLGSPLSALGQQEAAGHLRGSSFLEALCDPVAHSPGQRLLPVIFFVLITLV